MTNHNANRLCNDDDPSSRQQTLRNCVMGKKGITNIVLSKTIGEGTFGIVYISDITINRKKESIAVKLIRKKQKDFKHPEYKTEYINELELEVEYSYTMSEANIGPKVYDAFYVDGNEYLDQYILMEYMRYDGKALFDSEHVELDTKRYVFKKMCELIYKQIFEYDMHCFDVKPANFLINLSISKLPEVKMIDFGSDYCTKKMRGSKDTMYFFCVLQLYGLTLRYNKPYDIITSIALRDTLFLTPIKNSRKKISDQIDIGRTLVMNNRSRISLYVLYHYLRDIVPAYRNKYELDNRTIDDENYEQYTYTDDIMSYLYLNIKRDLALENIPYDDITGDKRDNRNGDDPKLFKGYEGLVHDRAYRDLDNYGDDNEDDDYDDDGYDYQDDDRFGKADSSSSSSSDSDSD